MVRSFRLGTNGPFARATWCERSVRTAAPVWTVRSRGGTGVNGPFARGRVRKVRSRAGAGAKGPVVRPARGEGTSRGPLKAPSAAIGDTH